VRSSQYVAILSLFVFIKAFEVNTPICGNLLTPKRSICGNIPICAYLWEFVDPTNLCKDKSFFNKSLKNQGKTFTEQKYLGNFASLSIKF